MKLIKDLGTKTYAGKKRRFGLYECPVCKKPFETITYSVQTGRTKTCVNCKHGERPIKTEKRKEVTRTFFEKCRKIHNNKYDYRLVEYKNNRKKIKIICPDHGLFLQTPKNHIKGHGCNLCHRQSPLRDKDFIKECKTIHNNKYDYSLTEYKNSRTKIKIICPDHGEFKQCPISHNRGRGCPSCAKGGFNPLKIGILYYIKITYNNKVLYKIGITNKKSVQKRFCSNDIAKIEVLETWKYTLGLDAYNKEQQILKIYSEYKYNGDPILSSGNTEIFTKDILNLDSCTASYNRL